MRRKRPDYALSALFAVNDGVAHRMYSVGVPTLTKRERETLRAKIDDYIISESIDFDPHNLPNIRITKGREQDYLNAHAALCVEGCDPLTLLWSLRLGRAALGRSVPSAPSAKAVKGMVKRLDKMAQEIRELEKSGYLLLIAREEVEKFYRETQLSMEDVEDFGAALPHLDLPRWIEKKSDMYRRWLKVASLRLAPKDNRKLTRLEYLFPAFYVREATGKPCLSILMQLFETIGIKVSKQQLTREFKSLRRDYRWLRLLMTEKLLVVNEFTSSMNEAEQAAFSEWVQEQESDLPQRDSRARPRGGRA